MANPTFEVLENIGEIRKVHIKSTSGYDELQKFKASDVELNNVLSQAAAHFESEHGERIPRLNAIHIPDNNDNVVEVELTEQDGVLIPLP